MLRKCEIENLGDELLVTLQFDSGLDCAAGLSLRHGEYVVFVQPDLDKGFYRGTYVYVPWILGQEYLRWIIQRHKYRVA